MFIALFILLFVGQATKGPSRDSVTLLERQNIAKNSKALVQTSVSAPRCDTFKKGGQPVESRNDYSEETFWLLAITAFGTLALAIISYFQKRDNRKSSESQLRAYVAVYPGKKEGEPPNFLPNEDGSENEVYFRVVNGGQTPAYNTAFRIRAVATTKVEERVDFDSKLSSSEWSKSVLTLQRDLPFQLTFQGVRPEELAGVRGGWIFVYYFGVVRYDDAFGHRHETKFRFMVRNVDTGTVNVCKGGNQSD